MDHRYQCFVNSTRKKKFSLASLPPTSSAAAQHSMRSYLQIQIWLNNYLSPIEWGWKNSSSGLLPISTNLAPAPSNVMDMIFCNCKRGCLGACGCRKVGIPCSHLCFCRSNGCKNSKTIDDSHDEDM